MKAIELCTNRFDDDTKHHLLTCTLKWMFSRSILRKIIDEEQKAILSEQQMTMIVRRR